MQIRYTAKRNLNTTDSPVHVVGTEYTMTVELKSLERKVKSRRFDAVSINGYQQSTFQRLDTEWSAMSVPVTGSDLLNFREFLDSVSDGSQFEFSDGVTGFVGVKITGKGYSDRRTVRQGTYANDYFSLGWTHREV